MASDVPAASHQACASTMRLLVRRRPYLLTLSELCLQIGVSEARMYPKHVCKAWSTGAHAYWCSCFHLCYSTYLSEGAPTTVKPPHHVRGRRYPISPPNALISPKFGLISPRSGEENFWQFQGISLYRLGGNRLFTACAAVRLWFECSPGCA